MDQNRTLLVFLLMLLLSGAKVFSQDTLPKLSVVNINNHIVISWSNPYTSLTTINIQRSPDSLKNFISIGTVLDVKNKTNGFVDAKPLSGRQYYRLFLSFEGGMYIFTNSERPTLDTSKIIPKEYRQSAVNTWFVPSKFIYTGRDNNVIISLPLAGKKKYLVKFFEENGNPVFEISKLSESYLTVDKVNFIHAGFFNFEIYEEGILLERHKFYIPKDGKVLPGSSDQGKNQR